MPKMRVGVEFKGKVELTPWGIQIVNPKGEMKGSAITGPVGKEAAELWPVCFNYFYGSYIFQYLTNYSVSRRTPA